MNRFLALPALLLAACAPAAQTADIAAPAPPPAMAAQTAAIPGNYTVTISPSDIPASAPQEMRSGLSGTWLVEFHGGNHFVVSYNGQRVSQGNYQLSGNRLSFGSTGETGPYACNTPATYTWAMNNDGQLAFTRVGEDECAGRSLVLTTRPLTRAP